MVTNWGKNANPGLKSYPGRVDVEHVSKGLITAVSMTTAAAVLGPLSAIPVTPILLLVTLTAAGSWKLWRMQRMPTDPDGNAGLTTQQRRQLEDDCELATFAALQEAAEFLSTAAELMDEGPEDPTLLARFAQCRRDIDDFVFTGNGLGDLAAAWSIEDANQALAKDTARRRRPAA